MGCKDNHLGSVGYITLGSCCDLWERHLERHGSADSVAVMRRSKPVPTSPPQCTKDFLRGVGPGPRIRDATDNLI